MSLLRSPVKIECVSESTKVTACGGSALLLEMMIASRALADLPVDAGTPSRGWTDGQMILTVMLLNILDHDAVSDVELLEADEAPGRLVRESEPAILGIARGRIKRRFRGGRERNFPSTRSLGQWLDRFHDAELHRTHPAGEAVVRPDGPRHCLLREVNRRLVALGAGLAKAETATIDLDATIIGSGKRDCHYTYRAGNRTVPGERGYQPLVAYVGEFDMAPWLEMRDGNVPASFENRRGLEATLRQLPESIRRATLRTDGAGYQEEVFRFCNDPAGRPADLRRFGVIGLFCGATRSEELMAEAKRLPEAAWQPLHKPGSGDGSKPGDDGDIIECAELPFVSNMTARAKPGHVIRYVATRRLVPDQFPVDAGQLPSRNGSSWEIRAYATNHPAPDAIPSDKANGLSVMTGPEVVRQAHLRCGRGEEIHSILKSDLAGGIMPSGRFGANAAWMLLTALSRNVVAATNLAADGLEGPRRIRMKRLRAPWLHIAARLVSSGRRFRLIFGESGRHIVKTVARIRHNIEKLLATQPHPPPRTAG